MTEPCRPDESGSSPLSRGIPLPIVRVMSGTRIIPALAGNTPRRQDGSVRSADHPRSRGEYSPFFRTQLGSPGSSPLSRGIPCGDTPTRCPMGIIPALAGNTCPRTRHGGIHPDHPRSRGEYPTPATKSTYKQGSSPLSRGIPGEAIQQAQHVRIIPALAGNTSITKFRIPSSRDHPRSRGEYEVVMPEPSMKLGSSPLSRGIRPARPTRRSRRGIIPALAGNTGDVAWCGPGTADHPRSRGEYVTTGAAEESGIGSSPLSRGILHHAARDVRVRRIIPALAGNTCSPRRKTHPPGDHPRSRGEYLEAYGLTVWQLGSSPLSRGIHQTHPHPPRCVGIIPALAGNTLKS